MTSNPRYFVRVGDDGRIHHRTDDLTEARRLAQELADRPDGIGKGQVIDTQTGRKDQFTSWEGPRLRIEGALNLADYVSLAEQAMERGGLAGKTIHMPQGHNEDPEYKRALAPIREWCQQIAGMWISVYTSDYILRENGNPIAVINGNNICVRPVTNEMTLLHEIAHLKTNTGETAAGHNAAFCRNVRELYERHLGHEAAEVFWNIVGPKVEGRTASAPSVNLVSKDFEGNVASRDHITRREDGRLPTWMIEHLHGVKGERPGEHRNRQGEAWEKFKGDIGANGIQHPIFITVDYNDKPRISEGNHRRDAAVELGHPDVPVEIRYFGHAQRQGTVAERAMQHTAARGPDSVPGRRDQFGYWLESEAGFLERGASMSGGGTAWLVWLRVPPDLIRFHDDYAYYQGHETTPVIQIVPEHGWPSVPHFNQHNPDASYGYWYVHIADAGSVAEARETARHLMDTTRLGSRLPTTSAPREGWVTVAGPKRSCAVVVSTL